ncbi:MAG: DUF4430 domain-containing protein [Syntrophomonadaceae bacterium]|nr:DUF4430 domain-containing protein [Syntrophomonadaceae bacterium]
MKKLTTAGLLIFLLFAIAGCGTDNIKSNDLEAAPAQKTENKIVTSPVPSTELQTDEQAEPKPLGNKTAEADKTVNDKVIKSDSKDTFDLYMTRDFGREIMDSRQVKLKPGYSLMEYMKEEWQITTGFGGGFIIGINGLESANSSGDCYDWFFYVNGEAAPVGAEQAEPEAGDIIYWDYHLWSSETGSIEVPDNFPPTVSWNLPGASCLTKIA